MSSFASLYAYNLLAENQYRIGLTNDQYQTLSAIFPYFEENAKHHAIEAMHCSNACSKLQWKSIQVPKVKFTREKFEKLVRLAISLIMSETVR